MTFSTPHVLKALQILWKERFVSRKTFCKELHIGEGAVKTLIAHMKEHDIVNSTRAGTFLTGTGRDLAHKLIEAIPNECIIEKCKIAQGKFNYAIILKNFANHITTGLEQRDYAILYGASGCITLQYIQNRLMFPGDDKDVLKKDKKTEKALLKNLKPKQGDVIIISSSDDKFVSEVSAKNSVLCTLASK